MAKKKFDLSSRVKELLAEYSVSGCELCGQPKYSNGMETHSNLCGAVRELQKRVAELEKRALSETPPR